MSAHKSVCAAVHYHSAHSTISAAGFARTTATRRVEARNGKRKRVLDIRIALPQGNPL